MKKKPAIAGGFRENRIVLVSAAAGVAAIVGSFVGGFVMFLVIGLENDIESIHNRVEALSVQVADTDGSDTNIESDVREIERDIYKAESRLKIVGSVRDSVESIAKNIYSMLYAAGRAQSRLTEVVR